MQKAKASQGSSSKETISAWIETELADIDLVDGRLNRRFKRIMSQISSQPSASIPQACEQWGDIKAAYRFFSNEKIEAGQLLKPHTHATVERMRSHKVILAVQDTTALNYSAHKQTEGLGPISNNPDKTLGFFLHTTLALTATGCPMGVLHAVTHSRNKKDFGQSRDSQKRNNKAVNEKESQRWLSSLSCCQEVAALCPDTTIVNIADREGDIYELFAQALQPSSPRVHLLVRVQHNRNVESAERRLWAHLKAQPEAATMQVQVPRQTGQQARTATLSVRFTPVTVCAPLLKEQQPSLSLWAIQAAELHPAKGVKPILWQLLTTLPLTGAAQAIERIGWYSQRWQIEVLHKVLKSGCNVERRPLETVPRLKRALMLDLILSWRIMYLSKVLREHPDQSASVHLTEGEWKVLWCKFHRTRTAPTNAPTIGQAVR